MLVRPRKTIRLLGLSVGLFVGASSWITAPALGEDADGGGGGQSAEERCDVRFAKFINAAAKATAAAEIRYDPRHEFPRVLMLFHRFRDKLRRQLQIFHGRDYPIIALDDATPVNAYALAADAFEKLPEEQKGLVDIPQIKASLGQLLTVVENYPSQLRAFLDETATMLVEEEVLKDFLKKHPQTRKSIEIEMPSIKTGSYGTPVMTTRKEFFSSEIQVLNHLKRIHNKLKERQGARFFGLDGINNLAVGHAINIKKLETYMHELMRAQSQNPGKALPEELQGYLTRFGALYKNPKREKIRQEFRPPVWAFNRLRWMQLGGEVRSVFQKDIPRLLDQEQNKKIIAFIQNLSSEERRALGITNAAKAADIVHSMKWISVIPIGSTVGGGFLEGSLRAYDYLIADSKAKEHCASLVEDQEFIECVQEYLQVRFPAKTIKELFSEKSAFVDPKGEVTDQEVRDEIDDVMARRQMLMQRDNFKEDARAQLSDFIDELMGTHDLSSESYRRRLIESKDDQAFLNGLLGSDNDGIASYLGFIHPLDFKVHEKEIRKLVALEPTGDEHRAAFNALAKTAPRIAEELKSLLEDRQQFKKWGIGAETRKRPQSSGSPSPRPGILRRDGEPFVMPKFWLRRSTTPAKEKQSKPKQPEQR